MPRLVPIRLAAACALALLLVLAVAAPALAKGPVAEIRVVGGKGKVLAEDSFGAGTASVKTSPKAECFGPGTGGSGKSVTVKGPTALGMLIQAASFTKSLRPLLISDHFSFGLALCGVGGFIATETGAGWYLKVNHVNPELGGESVKVKAGDEVLWAYVRFPYPDELALSAPDHVQPGTPFKVRVLAYGDDGKKKPVAGVKVAGASAPTGADGRTTVTLSKPARLIARHGADIPSNRETVCVGGRCPGSGR
ncbi:MAG TPA: hypothetical protein VNL97_07240 [Solirubrobacterales bacterium]|jgi:hypothetical protein|nr:hypothetical protein [Solirubrobacterales bacterium]